MPPINPLLILPVGIIAVLSLCVGILGWLLYRRVRRSGELETALSAVREELQECRGDFMLTTRDLQQKTEEADRLSGLLEHCRDEGRELRTRYGELERDFAVLHTRFEDARRQHGEQIRLLEEAKAALTSQFENLANRIFEQKSKSFDTANQQQLNLLLKPFREQIERFSKQARSQYLEESKERHLLKDEIARLKQLNERISEDALNLTNALKGENKTQGNWGEIILERVLESSGLRRGHEYETQGSYKDDSGNLLRPDVVVFLPQDRCVVIDSKVSLVAYEQFMSTEEPEQKAQALRQHIASVNAHIKGLSEKRYENLIGLRSLDFVLLFMPIEGAFHLALEHDGGFFKKAYESRIIVVSPTTLLATLRTIENLWRTEQQQQNARQIAKQAEDLYDKFVSFVADMQRIGDQLGRTQEVWEKAMNKLHHGKGNLIRRAEQMRSLGLSPKKSLPKSGDNAS